MAAIKIEEMTPKQLAKLVRDNPPGSVLSHEALHQLIELRRVKRHQNSLLKPQSEFKASAQPDQHQTVFLRDLVTMLHEIQEIAQRTSEQLDSEEGRDTA